MPYQRARRRGITFLFKFDEGAPDLLHIWVRHATTIPEALDTFFDPAAHTVWNDARRRFESTSATHVLHWFWLEENVRVMVITCWRR
jgi:hypothetical protein